MSDVQFLFAILGGLYAWECACWLRRGGVGFSTWTGRRWKTQHPATMVGNQNGGFILATPFPPLGTILTTYQLPFSLSPDGVLLFVSGNVNPGWRPAQSARFWTWAQLADLKLRGKKVLLHHQVLFTSPTTTLANHLFQALTSLAKLPADQRGPMIQQHLRAMLDSSQATKVWSAFKTATKPLRWLTNSLFVLIFIIAPLLIGLLGLEPVWLGLVIALLALTISIATLFARRHRQLWPAAEDDRFTQTLILALVPANSIRALDLISRPLLETFHPLTIAKLLLTPAAFRSFGRRILLDLRNPARPTCPNPDPQAIATEVFFRRTYLEVVEAWFTENKIPPEELCRAAAPADESCHAYCPRCEAQFTSTTGLCSDCGGLPLVEFRKAS
jgi:hypothetical protein